MSPFYEDNSLKISESKIISAFIIPETGDKELKRKLEFIKLSRKIFYENY